MISKTGIRYVRSLQDKKQRQKYDQFVVEGEKSITELLKSHYEIHILYALDEWIDQNMDRIGKVKVESVSESELKQISSHQSPQKVVAVVNIPAPKPIGKDDRFILALDEIQDPGNLGTILRIADWYGIKNIICSKGCTDIYNPKCINSTMGSFMRVNVVYDDIVKLSETLGKPLIVAVFDGLNIHEGKLPNSGIIVVGNEGHGISASIINMAQHRLTIPRFGGAESLNVAVSTAVLLDNLLRD